MNGRTSIWLASQQVPNTLNQSVHGLEMSGDRATVAKLPTTKLRFSPPFVSVLSNSRERRVSKRVFGKAERKDKLVDSTFRCAEDTHIRVDATKGNGEHAVEVHPREKNKGGQISHSEGDGEEACLDGTTNESV